MVFNNMKTLIILRHAKSSWDNTNLSDFDRPLAKRGIKDAKKLNNFLISYNLGYIFSKF